MLDDGLYTRFPKPDFALALHCTADQPTGDVALLPGADAGQLDLGDDHDPRQGGPRGLARTGRSTRSCWRPSSILDFQTIVSREIEPIQPAVVTVGSIHGGTKHNIIPDEVKLQLTLRAFSEAVRQQLIDGIERRVEGLAQAHQAPEPTVEVEESTPPTINTPELVERVVPAFIEALGADTSSRPRRSWAPRTSASSARGRPDLHVLAGDDRSRPARSGPIAEAGPARPPLVEVLTPTPARASRPASGP